MKKKPTKPRLCPFCGAKPITQWQDVFGRWVVACVVHNEHVVWVFGATRKEAIAAWNGEKK